MKTKHFNILLADDDIDDCSFFKEALEKLSLNSTFNVVNDGEKLMIYLRGLTTALPDVLFLDLNMHRKNGFECLEEIKGNPVLMNLPVIVFSTSFDQERVDMLYKSGAQYFMRKPPMFPQLMNAILQALTFIRRDLDIAKQASDTEFAGVIVQPDKVNFVLNSQSSQPV
jgi:CheY-like chemotaxis protein